MKKILFSAAVCIFAAASASAQLTIPQPSPHQLVKQAFATSSIEISYSRPSVKGRKIFGDVVPFDKVWRTGANQATTIAFGEEVKINNVMVPKGKYGLLTIPGKAEWTIIITKDTLVTGPSDYKQENDLVRIKTKATSIPMSVETFTIDINNMKANSCDVRLMWDRTAVSFNVTADIDKKIMAQIDEAMKGEKKPYYSAANYYYENGKDLDKALEWINEAIKTRPEAFWMTHLKAKILLKKGDYDAAIEAAKLSIEKAKEAKNDDYVAMNEKLIADAEKMKTKKK
jgi:hypothetical protein